MKKFLSIIFILFAFNFIIKAQNNQPKAPNMPVDDDTKLITYKAVITETGNKDELYNRAFQWFNKFFKNPTDVIKENNKDDGHIKGVARMKIYDDVKGVKTGKGEVEFTIITEIKDGRYRYIITNFNLKQASYFPLERWLNPKEPAYNNNANKYFTQIDAYVNDMIKNMQQSMKPVIKKKDDW